MNALVRYIEDYKQDPKRLDREQTEFMVNELVRLYGSKSDTELIDELEADLEDAEKDVAHLEREIEALEEEIKYLEETLKSERG